MTVEELCKSNGNMLDTSMCVIHCRYDNSQFRNSTDNRLNGCIIYQDEYRVMPKVLKRLEVLTFKYLKDSRSFDEPGK